MSNWQYKDVYQDDEAGYCIRKCISTYGDSHSGQCSIEGSNDIRPVGVHFLTKGSIKILDADCTPYKDYAVGERFLHDSLEVANKGKIIMVSKEATEYWCIADIPPYKRYWTGELTTLAPNESATISGVQGKRLFLPKACTVDGVDYPKHTVLKVESKDAVEVTNAGVTNVLANFWLDN